jgi:hypothetical protein
MGIKRGSHMLNVLRDPIWQFVGIIISITFSLIADATVIIKVVVCTALLGVFLILLLFRKQFSSALEKGSQSGVTSPKPTNPVGTSAQGLPLPLAHRP